MHGVHSLPAPVVMPVHTLAPSPSMQQSHPQHPTHPTHPGRGDQAGHGAGAGVQAAAALRRPRPRRQRQAIESGARGGGLRCARAALCELKRCSASVRGSRGRQQGPRRRPLAPMRPRPRQPPSPCARAPAPPPSARASADTCAHTPERDPAAPLQIYTVWNFRREALGPAFEAGGEAAQKASDEELALTQVALGGGGRRLP